MVSILLSNLVDPVNIVRNVTFQFLFPDNREPPLPKYFQGVFHPYFQLEILDPARGMILALMRDWPDLIYYIILKKSIFLIILNVLI